MVSRDPCVLFFFMSYKKAWERRMGLNTAKTWQSYSKEAGRRRGMRGWTLKWIQENIHSVTRPRAPIHTALGRSVMHGCTWESCSAQQLWSTEVISMYSGGPHTQQWQTYFKMISLPVQQQCWETEQVDNDLSMACKCPFIHWLTLASLRCVSCKSLSFPKVDKMEKYPTNQRHILEDNWSDTRSHIWPIWGL